MNTGTLLSGGCGGDSPGSPCGGKPDHTHHTYRDDGPGWQRGPLPLLEHSQLTQEQLRTPMNDCLLQLLVGVYGEHEYGFSEQLH